MTLQNRHATRKPTNKAGVIHADGKDYTVVLRDASSAGARLRLLRSIELPERFTFSAPLEKINATCQVVWRRGNDIGVKFE
ncbi:MAG TPA: PilZ domain-containing protein [Hyphomicrobium sp.]|nr:PilZ domain-containing protein [Hyphomicrobium sp.]HRO51076.1 PilZ domain-containing protein [Hyphomicrobium sp.]